MARLYYGLDEPYEMAEIRAAFRVKRTRCGTLLIRSGVNKARSFKGHVEGITGTALPVNSNRGYLANTCTLPKLKISSVVRPTLLYINSEAVIPAPISIGINSSGNPPQKHWIPPYQVRGRLSQARNDKESKGTSDALH
jgi:hypothetical protein